ncbi:hypothetical protein BJX70DRAFT_357450 [Aspergillus crustosus]
MAVLPRERMPLIGHFLPSPALILCLNLPAFMFRAHLNASSRQPSANYRRQVKPNGFPGHDSKPGLVEWLWVGETYQVDENVLINSMELLIRDP